MTVFPTSANRRSEYIRFCRFPLAGRRIYFDGYCPGRIDFGSTRLWFVANDDNHPGLPRLGGVHRNEIRIIRYGMEYAFHQAGHCRGIDAAVVQCLGKSLSEPFATLIERDIHGDDAARRTYLGLGRPLVDVSAQDRSYLRGEL